MDAEEANCNDSACEEDPAKALQIEASDGARVKSVKLSLQSTLECILATWKASLFAKCFPTLASGNMVLLETLRQSILQAARTDLYKGVSELVLAELLLPLQQLSQQVALCQQQTGDTAWRPSGDPLQDLASHDAKVLEYEKAQLLQVLTEQRAVTAKLKEEAQQLRYTASDAAREVEQLLQGQMKLRALCDQVSTVVVPQLLQKLDDAQS